MIEHRRVESIFGIYVLLVVVVYGGIVLWGVQVRVVGTGLWWAFDHLTVTASLAGFAVVISLFLALIGGVALRLYVDPPAQWVRWIMLAGVILGVGASTWYFRVERSLGDRTIFLEMLTHGKSFRMSQPLTTALYSLAYRWVQGLGWPPRNAVALVCSIASMALVWPFLEVLRGLPRAERTAAAVLVCSSSLGVLFFGYVETTGVALALALIYMWMARLYVQDQVKLWAPALVLGIAVSAHGMSLYLVPSFLLLFANRNGRPLHGSQLRRILTAGLAFMAPVIVVVGTALLSYGAIRGSLVGDSLGGADMRPFVPLSAPQPPKEQYTLFSLAHLADLANLFCLVSPYTIFLLLLALIRLKYAASTVWGQFLLVSAASGLLYAFLWNPDLGMKQDWDLFAPALLPLLLLGGHIFGSKISKLLLCFMAVLSLLNSVLFLRTFEPTRIWSPEIQDMPKPTVQHSTNLVWPGRFMLIGYDHVATLTEPGNMVQYQLYFRGLSPMPVGYTIFAHLIDAKGNLLTQDDHQPFPPTEYWIPGEVVTDTILLTVPSDVSSQAQLQVYIGAYFWQTLERLPVLYDGQAVNDHVVLLEQFRWYQRTPFVGAELVPGDGDESACSKLQTRAYLLPSLPRRGIITIQYIAYQSENCRGYRTQIPIAPTANT